MGSRNIFNAIDESKPAKIIRRFKNEHSAKLKNKTPLEYMIQKRLWTLIHCLLNEDNIKLVPEQFEYLAFQAIKFNQAAIITTLFKFNVSFKRCSIDGHCPHIAIQHENFASLELLLQYAPDLFKLTDHNGITPLGLALKNSAWEMVFLILDKLDTNLHSQQDLETGLKVAVENNLVRLVEKFLSVGADPNAFENIITKKYIWQKCLENDQPQILQLFLEYGADAYKIMRLDTSSNLFYSYIFSPAMKAVINNYPSFYSKCKLRTLEKNIRHLFSQLKTDDISSKLYYNFSLNTLWHFCDNYFKKYLQQLKTHRQNICASNAINEESLVVVEKQIIYLNKVKCGLFSTAPKNIHSNVIAVINIFKLLVELQKSTQEKLQDLTKLIETKTLYVKNWLGVTVPGKPKTLSAITLKLTSLCQQQLSFTDFFITLNELHQFILQAKTHRHRLPATQEFYDEISAKVDLVTILKNWQTILNRPVTDFSNVAIQQQLQATSLENTTQKLNQHPYLQLGAGLETVENNQALASAPPIDTNCLIDFSNVQQVVSPIAHTDSQQKIQAQASNVPLPKKEMNIANNAKYNPYPATPQALLFSHPKPAVVKPKANIKSSPVAAAVKTPSYA